MIIIVLLFAPVLHKTLCYGNSLEVPQGGICFYGEIRKKYLRIITKHSSLTNKTVLLNKLSGIFIGEDSGDIS